MQALFFHPDLSSDEILLPEDESKHCVRVLRMQKGDEIMLIDGQGNSALAVISDAQVKRCRLTIHNRTKHPSNRNYFLRIAVAPTKNFERMEWFIEKAVEAGIDEITFIRTKNGERTRVNSDRCEKISISALKQSKQFYLPEINQKDLSELLAPASSDETRLIAWCEADQQYRPSEFIQRGKTNRITILIGPEGDFTNEEIRLARDAGYKALSLGNTILRTETAALYMCMATKTILG